MILSCFKIIPSHARWYPLLLQMIPSPPNDYSPAPSLAEIDNSTVKQETLQ
jgi:hypothetical protein